MTGLIENTFLAVKDENAFSGRDPEIALFVLEHVDEQARVLRDTKIHLPDLIFRSYQRILLGIGSREYCAQRSEEEGTQALLICREDREGNEIEGRGTSFATEVKKGRGKGK
jgi:hypothetical protein